MAPSDEEVEAGAVAIRDVVCRNIRRPGARKPRPWSDLNDLTRQTYRQEARACLLAAASVRGMP